MKNIKPTIKKKKEEKNITKLELLFFYIHKTAYITVMSKGRLNYRFFSSLKVIF